jgi:hypothetical protein
VTAAIAAGGTEIPAGSHRSGSNNFDRDSGFEFIDPVIPQVIYIPLT